MVVVTPPPSPTRQRFFTVTQLAQLRTVLEALLPGSSTNPGDIDAGAADYVDFLLGGSDKVYYEIAGWRPLYTAGLAMLSGAAPVRLGHDTPLDKLFLSDMTLLLSDLSAGLLPGFPDADWQKRFFGVLRSHCLEGCFADPRWGGNQAGLMWKWLGYLHGPAQEFVRS